jgi:hypothetical protein
MIIIIKLANSRVIHGEKKPAWSAGFVQGVGAQKEYLKPSENTLATF